MTTLLAIVLSNSALVLKIGLTLKQFRWMPFTVAIYALLLQESSWKKTLWDTGVIRHNGLEDNIPKMETTWLLMETGLLSWTWIQRSVNSWKLMAMSSSLVALIAISRVNLFGSEQDLLPLAQLQLPTPTTLLSSLTVTNEIQGMSSILPYKATRSLWSLAS